MVKCDSSLQRTRFHCSRVQWWRASHHCWQRLALRMVILGLCAAGHPWKPISRNSWRTVLVLMLLPEAVWNSVVNVATEDRWFLCASALGGPVLWVCVVYHFPGSSSRAESWWTDLLEWWHPMTVPHWKSLSSSVRRFYCQYLSMEIAWLCSRFYTPVSNGCGWNSQIH